MPSRLEAEREPTVREVQQEEQVEQAGEMEPAVQGQILGAAVVVALREPEGMEVSLLRAAAAVIQPQAMAVRENLSLPILLKRQNDSVSGHRHPLALPENRKRKRGARSRAGNRPF